MFWMWIIWTYDFHEKKKKMWTTGKQNLRMTVLPPHRLISKWEKWHPEKPEQCLNKDLDHFHILLRATLQPWLSPNVGLKWGSWAGRSGTKEQCLLELGGPPTPSDLTAIGPGCQATVCLGGQVLLGKLCHKIRGRDWCLWHWEVPAFCQQMILVVSPKTICVFQWFPLVTWGTWSWGKCPWPGILELVVGKERRRWQKACLWTPHTKPRLSMWGTPEDG